jgi:signal recognition particle GTPase
MTRSGGGAATAGGIDYQNRVSAWVAVQILAENQATPPWGLPTGTIFKGFRCETEHPVDDLMVEASNGGLIVAQIKRTVNLTNSPESGLASALDQMVRQFIACRTGVISTGSTRPLDPSSDRFLLMASSNSSRPIKQTLPRILEKIRSLPLDQPLSAAAANNEEHRVFSKVQKNLTRSWREVFGSEIQDIDLRQLLSLIHVHILDLEDGSQGEREAKNLLRSSVLQDHNDAVSAWSMLITRCGVFASTRSGTDRSGLQRELLKAGIELQAPPSYRNDISELRNYSESTLDALTNLSQIKIGTTSIKIQREPSNSLKTAVEKKSLLVVGEPGAGKSGAIHDLANTLAEKQCDYVLLAVDRLDSTSRGHLRAELNLDHDLLEVLDNWPGTQPAFLIIDALDAARGDQAAAMVRELIDRLFDKAGRWHVVASIRKFDLRYSAIIKDIFKGSPVTEFYDSEFSGICHINIPHLTSDDFDQIEVQSSELHALIQNSPEDLQALLRIPFNLMLVAGLIGEGETRDQLAPIKTQGELLDRYWERRVIGSDQGGDAREGVLRTTCERMIADRVLRVDRSMISGHETSSSLTQLLSAQVLVEWQASSQAQPDRYTLAFSHHILFDYAVARLLLRGAPGKAFALLEHDPELVIVIRPSLMHHFRHLWEIDANRNSFWDLIFDILGSEKIPEIGKLIGPSVGPELVNVVSDLEPLFKSFENSNIENEVADQSLCHLLGALLVDGPNNLLLVGPGAGPWCQLLERVSRSIRSSVAYAIRPLLLAVCEHTETPTTDQLKNAGLTARRLTEYAWLPEVERDHWLIIQALRSVCRTFKSDPNSSADIIRQCLEHEHLLKYGFEEMPWLAREIKQLFTLDPVLCEDFYMAAFEHQEKSKETTPVGGRILPISSNRQQDYRMTLYELAKVFPDFLEQAPENATRALISVIESYMAQDHQHVPIEAEQEIIDFNGTQARFCTDHSHIWDAGDRYRHDEPLKMLDSFEKYLGDLANEQGEVESLGKVIDLLVSENRLAALWRRVLLVASRSPDTLGRLILPLTWSIPILTSFDTRNLVGNLLRVIFPLISKGKRERIEQTILDIPDGVDADRFEYAERNRDRLLGCLPESDLVTAKAKTLLAQLKAKNDIPPNKPTVEFGEWSSKAYGEEEHLKEQGVPVETEANKRIRELELPIKEFVDKHMNSVPTLSEVTDLSSPIQALYEALSFADANGVHPKQRDYGWGKLAEACARISRINELSQKIPVARLTKIILLEASNQVEPIPDPEHDSKFGESLSWGMPAARISAAQGLIRLANNPEFSQHDVLEAIARLSQDSVPTVRFQIASGLTALYKTVPELMWQIIERLGRDEPNRGVLQALLGRPLNQLAGHYPDEVTNKAKMVFDRVLDGPGAEMVRAHCIGIFTGLYIWRNQPQCGEVIKNIVLNFTAHLDDVSNLIKHFREPLDYVATDGSDPTQDATRKRAVDLLHQILKCARSALSVLEVRYKTVSFNDWPKQDRETLKSLMQIIDHIGSEIYFASGAYKAKEKNQPEGQQEPQLEKMELFYKKTGPILDELADIGLASVTHHLLETLEFLVPIDPRGMFLRIGRLLKAGQQGGYQYESLAADLVVKLVEGYLADHRALLRNDSECRQVLIDVLDIFVKVGWPSARRLTYRLEEIFR